MKTKDVAKLPAVERFLYWIRERHAIYLRRKAGKSKPWTDDEVLQRYFFTNPYRENDKTTVWFRENVRDRLYEYPTVLMATVIFRWFNRISTGQLLHGHGLLTHWNKQRAVQLLTGYAAKGERVFTGAYMIKSPTGERKIDGICRCISNVWSDRRRLIALAEESATLREVHAKLMTYPFLGKFMAYEIVTDLRHTYLLEDAKDIDTWCALGPGAIRGILRLSGYEQLPKNKRGRTKRKGLRPPSGWQECMINLLATARRRLRMPLEMREVEHSLCEYDKYCRVVLDQGKSKRLYSGV